MFACLSVTNSNSDSNGNINSNSNRIVNVHNVHVILLLKREGAL